MEPPLILKPPFKRKLFKYIHIYIYIWVSLNIGGHSHFEISPYATRWKPFASPPGGPWNWCEQVSSPSPGGSEGPLDKHNVIVYPMRGRSYSPPILFHSISNLPLLRTLWMKPGCWCRCLSKQCSRIALLIRSMFLHLRARSQRRPSLFRMQFWVNTWYQSPTRRCIRHYSIKFSMILGTESKHGSFVG